jgi:hypothetical protein
VVLSELELRSAIGDAAAEELVMNYEAICHRGPCMETFVVDADMRPKKKKRAKYYIH